MSDVVIGKRVTVGAVFTSIAGILSHFWPEHASVFVAAAVPITFVSQVLIAKYGGVTGAGRDSK